MANGNFNAQKPFGDLGRIISNKGKMLSRFQAPGPGCPACSHQASSPCISARNMGPESHLP